MMLSYNEVSIAQLNRYTSKVLAINKQIKQSVMDSKINFLPFHAINGYMRPDYQSNVARIVLTNLPRLSEDTRSRINNLIRKLVVIQGFRNSMLAPPSLKLRPYISTMEKNAELTAITLKAWADLNDDLRARVFELLKERTWGIIPADADRTKLPGFLTTWPENEDFETINQAYKEKYPDLNENSDDISLMAAWLSGRLPFQDGEEG